jgi:hypothetical protein
VPVDCQTNCPWTRKHDKPSVPRFASVPRVCYPTTLADLIEICRNRDSGDRLRAGGSHWALSEAAFSDHTFIETHDPVEAYPAMGRTIHDLIPSGLSRTYTDYLKLCADDGAPTYLVHVEAGKRIYQLYSELDVKARLDRPTLAAHMYEQYDGTDAFVGPWAPHTLGGAGGQTIVGALNTGTHGGDFDRPPVADCVKAIHLVADGGKHYWIEPARAVPFRRVSTKLIEDERLYEVYGAAEYGGRDNFEIIRDDEMFNAVLVSAGRFGIIYSVVLVAIPQHNIYERRRIHVWQDIKRDIKNRGGILYNEGPSEQGGTFRTTSPASPSQRFLQIAVCLTPHAGFSRNLVGITKRWDVPILPYDPLGREHRRGGIEVADDPLIQGPRFANAGRNYAFDYDPDTKRVADPGLLENACANASFMLGLIETLLAELEDFVTSEGGIVGATIASILVPGAGGALLLIPAIRALMPLLRALADALGIEDTLGDFMNRIREELLDPPIGDPARKAAGLFIWQAIAYAVFQLLQKDNDVEGISYAMMDRRDYRQQSCEENVDSVEVFFDALDDRLIAFVDALIHFEIVQELRGKAFLGYASLRFTGPSRALLGEQLHDTSCAVEVACLKDMEGSQELVDYATALALDPNINGLLHWGQRNDYIRPQVEARYGQRLVQWRQQLARITNNGALDRFSSAFTRRTGLEVI